MTANPTTSGALIEATRLRADISQRALAARAEIPQAILSRIESGQRAPKVSEMIAIAGALGCSLSAISEFSPVRDRAIAFARAENGSEMTGLRGELVHFLELDAYLDEYGIA